jgi:tetratricopeptide (TPR) repeat protein
VHRTILVVDVAGFGDPRRTNLHRVAVRQGLYELLRLAFVRSSIPWDECDHEDRGDGVLVMVPANVPKSVFAESLPRELVSALLGHNRGRGVEEQIRLRLALHAGEIHYDKHGVVGGAVNLAFRLLDAPVLKDALAESSGLLAVITSSWFYDEVVWHSASAKRETYVQVRVAAKETDAVAWICLPDSTVRPSQTPLPGPDVPHQLPANIRQFVGREEELGRLMDLLDSAAGEGTVVITAIDGSAGIGKTALAMHWAHQVKDRFPDGQLHVNLRGFDQGEPMDAGQALHGFLQGLGVDANAIPVDLDSRAALYRSLLAERRMLIVLDNASSSEHVRPLLPASPNCVAIVTSRRRLDGLTVREGAYRIALDVMSTKDSMALLAERVEASRFDADPLAAGELAELCVRLPLALSIVAARVAGQPTWPLRGFVRELRDERKRLDILDLGDTDLSVRAVFSWSYNVLSPPAAKLFRLLGVHPGPDIDGYACDALMGTSSRELLNELIGAHLLVEHAPGRFRFHDLLRAYATERAAQEKYVSERAEGIERFLDFTSRLAVLADLTIQPCRDGVVRVPDDELRVGFPAITTYADAIDWFVAETPTLLAQIRFAAEHGYAGQARHLAWACTTYLRRSGRWQERAMVHRTALAVTRRSGDQAGLVAVLRHLAPAVARLGRYDEALGLLREAAELVESLDDDMEAIGVYLAFTGVFEGQESYADALVYAEKAWQLARRSGNRLRQGDVLSTMSKELSSLGRHSEALPLCEQALANHTSLDHVEGQAVVLVNLGDVEHRIGRHARAVSCYQRALEIDRWLGDRYWEAVVLDRLGDAYLATGDELSAEKSWREAVAVYRDLRHSGADRVQAKLDAQMP